MVPLEQIDRKGEREPNLNRKEFICFRYGWDWRGVWLECPVSTVGDGILGFCLFNLHKEEKSRGKEWWVNDFQKMASILDLGLK